MEEKILKVIRKVFVDGSITANSSQDNCEKWDSMGHLNLIIALEDAFDTDFEPEEISKMKSVKDIIKIIESRQS